MDAIAQALAESADLRVPDPVEEIVRRDREVMPKLTAQAVELARQVYYLQHGSVADAARAVIAAGLADTDDFGRVYGRLRVWWKRESWPKRSARAIVRIRDAGHDGGLYRGERSCQGTTTGNGLAPAGKPCSQTALPGSDYCAQHDPRPEYVERRRRQGQLFLERRSADMVPVEPFQEWMDRTRREMLERARASREPPGPRSAGWGLLADHLGVSATAISRVMRGTHNGDARLRGRETVSTIRARTVVRYLDGTGVSFHEVYGYDPPEAAGATQTVCPSCGLEKNPESKTCLACYEQSRGSRCAFVNRAGRRCTVTTSHQSGYCYQCRKVVERVPRPRIGKVTWVSDEMLALALSSYVEVPVIASAAARMWACDAAGVRSVFKSRQSLESGLVKRLAKLGISDMQAAAAVRDELADTRGPVVWPDDDRGALTYATMLPLAPFGDWLAERHREIGSYQLLAQRTGLNADRLSQWIRRGGSGEVARRTVERALRSFDDGTTLADLYPGASA